MHCYSAYEITLPFDRFYLHHALLECEIILEIFAAPAGGLDRSEATRSLG